MESMGKIIAVFAIVAAVIVVGIVAFRQWAASQTTDGPDMVYDIRNYELRGTWVEVGTVYGDPGTMTFTKDTITYSVYNGTEKTGYSLDETGALAPDEERRIDFTDRGPYEYLVLHREEVNGVEMAILSGIVIELDGRGPVVFGEYVLKENVSKVPEGFESTVCIRENSKQATPSYIMRPYLSDVLDTANWIGLLSTDSTVAAFDLEEDGSFARLEFEGSLFDCSASGHAFLSKCTDTTGTDADSSTDVSGNANSDDDAALYVIDSITVISYDIAFDEALEGLTTRFGEPTLQGEEPYAVANGGAVLFAYFNDGTNSYRLSTGSNNNWLSIEIQPQK